METYCVFLYHALLCRSRVNVCVFVCVSSRALRYAVVKKKAAEQEIHSVNVVLYPVNRNVFDYITFTSDL